MPLLNLETKELVIKIVYYGPALGGKTTNLQYLYNYISPKERGEFIQMATETERTLYFDYLPLDLEAVNDEYKVKMALYTVPGQVQYNRSRQMILQGVDAIVFVADSSRDRAQANVDSLLNMMDNLKSYDLELKNLPWVLQFNKRDLINTLPLEAMQTMLNTNFHFNVPAFESIATEGKGVFAPLKTVSKLAIQAACQTAD
jgi:signal recognition particle receptor subunit beta